MTITIVCDVLGGENNGTSVATMNLVRSLKAKGHTVRILCCDAERADEEGVFVCPKRNFGPFNGYVRRVGVTLARPDEEIVRRALDGADLAHCMLPFALSKTALRLAHGMGIPVTAGFHCQAENFTNHLHLKNSRLASRLTYRYFYNGFYSDTDCVHYPSAFIREVFERTAHPINGRVISNGVGDEFFPHASACPEEADGKFVILSTGRFSREKCQSVLIEAVGRSRHRQDIRLILAGQGSLDGKYRRLCEKRRVDAQLRLFPRGELLDVLGYADLYVHPADIELEGIAVLEAMKCGLPVVVSDSARSAPRLLARDGRNLFRTGDPADLAERIDYWIEHPAERKECGRYYASSGDAVSRESCMEEMERMFLDTVAEYRFAHAPASCASAVRTDA